MIIIPTQTFKNLSIEKQNRITDAAVTEFSTRRFHDAKLSEIIKQAKIPRGSFYQYFNDKMDLYLYIFDIMAKHKMMYLTDDLKNPQNLSFFDLFRELYKAGLRFAYDYPEYVKITSLLLATKDLVYEQVFGNNINIAKTFYKSMILKDQASGRMDKLIDSDVLADLVIKMTMNVTFDSLEISEKGINFEDYEKKIEKVIYIFEKGIRGN